MSDEGRAAVVISLWTIAFNAGLLLAASWSKSIGFHAGDIRHCDTYHVPQSGYPHRSGTQAQKKVSGRRRAQSEGGAEE